MTNCRSFIFIYTIYSWDKTLFIVLNVVDKFYQISKICMVYVGEIFPANIQVSSIPNNKPYSFQNEIKSKAKSLCAKDVVKSYFLLLFNCGNCEQGREFYL